ncbi:MAG: hypothetical protein ACKOAY_00845 [Haliscomenobacter sp.]
MKQPTGREASGGTLRLLTQQTTCLHDLSDRFFLPLPYWPHFTGYFFVIL